MAINKSLIMTMAGRFLNPQKSQKLSEAFDIAQNLLNTSGSPQEALKKANVSQETLQQLTGYLNNPMANALLKPLGLDASQTKAMLDQLRSTYGADTQSGVVPPTNGTQVGGDLKALQDSLAKLKK